MTFRARLALVAAAAVAVAVVAASAIVYVVVRGELYAPIDDSLRRSAAHIVQDRQEGHLSRAFFIPQPELGGAGGYPQIVKAGGETLLPQGQEVKLPVDDTVRAVAGGTQEDYFRDAHIAGQHVRIFTFEYAPGAAVEMARSLTETDDALDRIRWLLLAIAAIGIAVAAGLGLVVSRAALQPVRRLTETTERVTDTGDLSQRIETQAGSRDELSRLATSFNTMLAALEDSSRAQKQLVADASHELRTPLTSLRTNIEVLASGRELPPGERERLLKDVIEQTGELTTLVAELIEVARTEQQTSEPEDMRLDLVTAQAVDRVRRDRPGVTFTTTLNESVVHGVPANIERAVANLLDNAAKWSPPDGEVEVSVTGDVVTVRDYGPGIAEEDLPFVFDRFYRAASARGMPGSGLGLAIVRQVAEAHGGGVTAERAEGGGTRMTLRLNGSKPAAS